MFKIITQKYASFIYLFLYFAEYYGFPDTEIFGFWKSNFCPFQWGIALYGTVNNSRDNFLKVSWSIYFKKNPEGDNELNPLFS